ncbi:D-alanyl-D-alanine dipeptidase [Aquimarina sp. MAR_2010_214]|uniref:M15 family metallopeptidase n=1 Tax=Aquimarina sp. MAR_2010_214 TaxID=1250026 RepID=UPI000CC9BAF5|nr:M15 family metallopeptidase [Aquimarina sp. MAR_2010_214]PKV48121.1 D-alanyl-D-alanine dipeptidase [Aquimarina sp. MAR_2010_214]
MIKKKLILLIFSVLFFSCSEVKVAAEPTAQTLALIEKSKALQLRGEKVEQSMLRNKDSLVMLIGEPSIRVKVTSDDKDFVNIMEMSNEFILDMKYATSDNFLKEKVYACAECFVRKEVAVALIKANDDLLTQGYRIKFFDCYRPYSVQKKMWKIFPNPGYVADPKGGSVHNRGAAVDITLVRSSGGHVDMGTDFDHFGKEAHHSYTSLSPTVLGHRKLLRETMEKHGFKTIRTEWWHYNFKGNTKFKISDFRWKCD